MNIFYLHQSPSICAEQHVDKHVVKMILEYSQLLSTAHRLIDGTQAAGLSKTGRSRKVWRLPESDMDENLYSATHMNHPSAVWVRKSVHNYKWLLDLLSYLCKEYTHRYGKVHAVERKEILDRLYRYPVNIDYSEKFTPPTLAMPDEYKTADAVESYRNYYLGSKSHMFSWKGRCTPEWINKQKMEC